VSAANRFGPDTFGDPCRECGFAWSDSEDAAAAVVAAAPDVFDALLAGHSGTERHPALGWSAGAYVCHVADNLRIWAERLAALAGAPPGGALPVAPYDQDALARVRRYEEIAVAGALWSLRRAAADWHRAVASAGRADVTMVHPERGVLGRSDVVRTNAHDTAHHVHDVRRILSAPKTD